MNDEPIFRFSQLCDLSDSDAAPVDGDAEPVAPVDNEPVDDNDSQPNG